MRNELAEIPRAATKYDLPKALVLTEDCRDLALRLRKMGRARECDGAMFVVARYMGDARAMVESDYWWKQHGFPSGVNEASRVFAAFHGTDFAKLLRFVPALSAQVTDQTTVLKYVHRIEIAAEHGVYRLPAGQPVLWRRPTVNATINGKPVAVLVDTGTAFPLVMDQARATALGATPLLGRLVAPQPLTHARGPFMSFTTDVVASLKIGGLVMHNVAATIVPDGVLQAGVIVGLPVLARFGQVRLSDTQITPGPTAGPRCASATPLRSVGGGHLGFSIKTNGKSAMAFIDTGNAYALIAGWKLTPGAVPVKRKTAAPKSDDVPTKYIRRLRVQIGSWPLTGLDVPVIDRALPYGVDVNIGAPLLALADVQMDFAKPSMCINPRPEVKKVAVIMAQKTGDEPANGPMATIITDLMRIFMNTSSPSDTPRM